LSSLRRLLYNTKVSHISYRIIKPSLLLLLNVTKQIY
jgi:hypothetical protein